MGWVEIYTIATFCIGLGMVFYALSNPSFNTLDYPSRFCYKWIAILPLIGRIFGWW